VTLCTQGWHVQEQDTGECNMVVFCSNLQAPLQLGAACSKAPTALGHPRDNAAALTASFQQLAVLLGHAKQCALFAETGTTAAKRTLGSSLLQQLQQSGLPQALPATLSAVTQRLQQLTEGITPSAAAVQDSIDDSLADLIGTADLSQSVLLATIVLETCVSLLDTPDTVQQVVFIPAAAAPAMELALAALKHTDCELKQRQQRQDRDTVMRVLSAAGEAALGVLREILVAGLLPFGADNSENLPIATLGMALNAVVTVHHESLQSLTSMDHNSSSSSSSSGGGGSSSSSSSRTPSNSDSSAADSSTGSRSGPSCSSSSPLSPQKAWELVVQHKEQLPTFHPLLFDVLGVSQQLLAWLAVDALGKLTAGEGQQCDLAAVR
jgi:hypothetical protein